MTGGIRAPRKRSISFLLFLFFFFFFFFLRCCVERISRAAILRSEYGDRGAGDSSGSHARRNEDDREHGCRRPVSGRGGSFVGIVEGVDTGGSADDLRSFSVAMRDRRATSTDRMNRKPLRSTVQRTGSRGEESSSYTCHDGSRQTTFVSHNVKHNETNGEGNATARTTTERNCGVEGPTDDPVWEPAEPADQEFLTCPVFTGCHDHECATPRCAAPAGTTRVQPGQRDQLFACTLSRSMRCASVRRVWAAGCSGCPGNTSVRVEPASPGGDQSPA